MFFSLGIICVFVALFGWGVGDFFIQNTVRKIGIWKALFFIGIIGAIALFPFIVKDLAYFKSTENLFLFAILGVIAVLAALFNFESLVHGKISVMAPLLGIELPLTVGLSAMLLREVPSVPQLVFMSMVFLGIIALAFQHKKRSVTRTKKSFIIEKGSVFALMAGIGLALSNLLVGMSSRSTSPLVTIWFTHAMVAIVTGIYLIKKKEIGSLFFDLKKFPIVIVVQSILDNIAWIGYALATTLIPVAVAATVSESYIVIAALLGVIVNKEKLQWNQIIGIIVIISGVLLLSIYT